MVIGRESTAEASERCGGRREHGISLYGLLDLDYGRTVIHDVTIFKMYGFPLGVRLSLYSGVPYRAYTVHGFTFTVYRDGERPHLVTCLVSYSFSPPSLSSFVCFSRLIWDVPVVK